MKETIRVIIPIHEKIIVGFSRARKIPVMKDFSLSFLGKSFRWIIVLDFFGLEISR